MQYKILLSKTAEKQLDKLSRKIQATIFFAIEQLIVFSPKTQNVKKLKTPFLGYRKRVGNYRILFEVEKNKKQIIIYKIAHRKKVYLK